MIGNTVITSIFFYIITKIYIFVQNENCLVFINFVQVLHERITYYI